MISPLCCPLLKQIDDALGKMKRRILHIDSANNFTGSPAGMEKLDGICMLFIAIGEALKHIDKMTGGYLLSQYPEIDWKGAIGFRDIIAHHYFDIDADQVFWTCRKKELEKNEMILYDIKDFCPNIIR